MILTAAYLDILSASSLFTAQVSSMCCDPLRALVSLHGLCLCLTSVQDVCVHHVSMALLRAVPSYNEDVMLIDLERRFRPRLYPFFFPPIVLWVHVIVHLVGSQGPHGGMTTQSVNPMHTPPRCPKQQ